MYKIFCATETFQVSHLHMLLDTVQLAQLNRYAKELLAQKENSKFVYCLRHFDAGFFVNGEAQAERGKECMYEYMTDRARVVTKPDTKKTSQKRVFWVIWSSD